ncbi:MAG TPA: bifunctional glutamate N-acetyltransferase/amino-acid acetyltransferase ArgJ [Vicinamibacterales bacterium]|nr:bifunctional glutamate N-acetyltransferase/amino-acid acetyltransferase ArgJ [Vicinamibacterales bacterium]
MSNAAARTETRIQTIEGGITAPAGFKAAGVYAGIKPSTHAWPLDVMLMTSEHPVSAAAVFTTNKTQAAPVIVSRENLEKSGGRAQAIVCNSGCANACTGDAGMIVARSTVEFVAQAVGCRPEEVLVASTGVIGVDLNFQKVKDGVSKALAALNRDAHYNAMLAIMTTDPFPKEAAVSVETAAGTFRVGGMTKGSGMIEPMMATMLAFLTCDAQVDPIVLQKALMSVTRDTFNAITVDGECSTNDSVFAMASGASGVVIDEALYPALEAGLRAVSKELATGIVRGGEGATKLITVRVIGANEWAHAERAARTIANSLLVKTAVHGGDPNWGRLVAAAGRSGVPFDLARASVRIGGIVLFDKGQPHDQNAEQAAAYLKGKDIDIEVDLGTGGREQATIWTCDLSAEYVRINADYRT